MLRRSGTNLIQEYGPDQVSDTTLLRLLQPSLVGEASHLLVSFSLHLTVNPLTYGNAGQVNHYNNIFIENGCINKGSEDSSTSIWDSFITKSYSSMSLSHSPQQQPWLSWTVSMYSSVKDTVLRTLSLIQMRHPWKYQLRKALLFLKWPWFNSDCLTLTVPYFSFPMYNSFWSVYPDYAVLLKQTLSAAILNGKPLSISADTNPFIS